MPVTELDNWVIIVNKIRYGSYYMGLTVWWVEDINQIHKCKTISVLSAKNNNNNNFFIACDTGSTEMGKDWVKVIQISCLRGHSSFLSQDDDSVPIPPHSSLVLGRNLL